jgi:hypothetical protein
MDTGIGASGGMENDLLPDHRLRRFFHGLLHRRTMGLSLEPHEGVPSHSSVRAKRVIAGSPDPRADGIARPRNSAAVSIAGRPARCTRVGRRPFATGNGERVVDHGARLSRPCDHLRGQHAIAFALEFEESPRRGASAPDVRDRVPTTRNRAGFPPCRSCGHT